MTWTTYTENNQQSKLGKSNIHTENHSYQKGVTNQSEFFLNCIKTSGFIFNLKK